MPKYTFSCNKCSHIESRTLSITEFLENKKQRKSCSRCSAGVLYQKLGSVSNKVDKNALEIAAEVKEDVRKTVDKIRSGDERTIRDIYGDRENPHKR